MRKESHNPPDKTISDLSRLIAIINESELSSIKKIVSELIRLINDPNSSARNLREVIELDSALTASLLKLANSAFYGYSRLVSSIQDAIVCVGFNQLKELALSQKISEIFDQSKPFAGYSRKLLWKHCVSVAICGKLIYSKGFGEKGGNAYVAGLIHDIGIVIEDHFLTDLFSKVLDKVLINGEDFIETEKSVFGYNHTQIGHAIANDWNFPEEIAVSLLYHHDPTANIQKEHSKLAYTLCIADSLCHSVNFGYCDAGINTDRGLFRVLVEGLNRSTGLKLSVKFFEAITAEVRESIEKMEKQGWF